jgi:hypothetical protein
MFGADRRNMGVMMRHSQRRNLQLGSQAQGKVSRLEIRMQVMGDAIRLNIEDAQQMTDRFFEKADCRSVVETADVLREESLPAFHDANSVFQVAAQGQHHRAVIGQGIGTGV